MDPVVHFEMPYVDKNRLAEFYKNAFDWKMQSMGDNMGNYVLAQTTDTDDNHMVKTPGNINGGFFPKDNDKPGYQMPSVVVSVKDLKLSIEKVKTAGGKVLGEPMEIPGIGMFVSIEDSEGNRLGMLQPMM